MPTEIRIACDVKERAPLDSFLNFQGRLKALPDEAYKRLKREILQTGFAFPIFVWENHSDKKLIIIGGHQRLLALKMMREEGAIVPDIPYVKIHAKNLKEAKRRVLQDVSQYGQVTQIGLLEYMHAAEFDFKDISSSFVIPDFDINSFQMEYFPDTAETKQVTFTAKVGGEGKVVEDPSKEWVRMPEFSHDGVEAHRIINVRFEDDQAVEEFFRRIGQKYTEKTKSIWFPEKEKNDLASERYEEE
jgi:hypothetical protein